MNLTLDLGQDRPPAVVDALDQLATAGGIEERGAVFTRSGVVDAILDLSGYTTESPLADLRLLEPSFGDGDFLLAAIDRLCRSYARTTSSWDDAHEHLSDAIRGVELHRETFHETARRAVDLLHSHGVARPIAETLVGTWLINDDFLLVELNGAFDFVVGNPPYVRQERVPDPLLQEYKRLYTTLYDRADLYVLFYERGLDLLRRGGALGYICANRWIKNRYGGPLREKIGRGFNLQYFLDLERADAFHSEVIAYPAITIVRREEAGRTYMAHGHRDSADGLDDMVRRLLEASEDQAASTSEDVSSTTALANGRDPWLLEAPEVLEILRRLEADYPTLEAAGSSVGIGVATGADKIFIGPYDELPVEDSRKLRMVMAADCHNGRIEWSGQGVVNPYLESGQLAPLDEFPRFAAYMREHEAALRKRHTARKAPQPRWYKTIDRIYPTLTDRPKLLIPDIKGAATVAFDEGGFYPHHNLYTVTSDTWDLEALKAVLRSSVALSFVAAYCVRMSGGFLRFQAQYLRRIRCPAWNNLNAEDRGRLTEVAHSDDQEAIDRAVFPLYGLSTHEQQAIREYAASVRVKGSAG